MERFQPKIITSEEIINIILYLQDKKEACEQQSEFCYKYIALMDSAYYRGMATAYDDCINKIREEALPTKMIETR